MSKAHPAVAAGGARPARAGPSSAGAARAVHPGCGVPRPRRPPQAGGEWRGGLQPPGIQGRKMQIKQVAREMRPLQQPPQPLPHVRLPLLRKQHGATLLLPMFRLRRRLPPLPQWQRQVQSRLPARWLEVSAPAVKHRCHKAGGCLATPAAPPSGHGRAHVHEAGGVVVAGSVADAVHAAPVGGTAA